MWLLNCIIHITMAQCILCNMHNTLCIVILVLLIFKLYIAPVVCSWAECLLCYPSAIINRGSLVCCLFYHHWCDILSACHLCNLINWMHNIPPCVIVGCVSYLCPYWCLVSYTLLYNRLWSWCTFLVACSCPLLTSCQSRLHVTIHVNPYWCHS